MTLRVPTSQSHNITFLPVNFCISFSSKERQREFPLCRFATSEVFPALGENGFALYQHMELKIVLYIMEVAVARAAVIRWQLL